MKDIIRQEEKRSDGRNVIMLRWKKQRCRREEERSGEGRGVDGIRGIKEIKRNKT